MLKLSIIILRGSYAFLLWLISFIYAEVPTIIVEEHSNIEVYINTPKILNYLAEIESIIDRP